MCVFAADGCATGIPDDFPLADGYPDDDEAEGPRLRPAGSEPHPRCRSSSGACGRLLPDTDPRPTGCSARWTNVEDFRTRQLTVFPDAGAATARVAALTDFYRACPSEDEQRRPTRR